MDDVTRMPLMGPPRWGEQEALGKMVVTKSEDKVHIDILLEPKWAHLIRSGDFVLHYYPMPGFPKLPKKLEYPTEESHIVRGEN